MSGLVVPGCTGERCSESRPAPAQTLLHPLCGFQTPVMRKGWLTLTCAFAAFCSASVNRCLRKFIYILSDLGVFMIYEIIGFELFLGCLFRPVH